MNYKAIRGLLRGSVKPAPCPAVFISGGLDSTILLKHLTELTDEPVDAIHIRLPGEREYEAAASAAGYYGARYHEVAARDILETFAEVVAHFDWPRFNLWPVYGYAKAQEIGCENVYVAEGLDEHFGGYINKPRVTYQEYWGGVIEWSLPTHRRLAELHGVKLHTPFVTLPVAETLQYWVDPHDSPMDKWSLRQAYRGHLPKDVLERVKYAGRVNWERPEIWDAEIRPHLGVGAPATHEEANCLVNQWITRRWLDARLSRR